MKIPVAGNSRAEFLKGLENQPRIVRAAMRTARLLSGVALLVLPALVLVPARAADVVKGAQVYARHCAACHGPNGNSVMPSAPQLIRGERMMQSDMALLASLKVGKNAMPAYLGILADAEILDVIAYSRTLRR